MSMLDADANQLLTRADALAQQGKGQDAARVCESAADLLLTQGNFLVAAVAYQRALHQLQRELLPREQKVRISERLAAALNELGMAGGLSRERRIDCLFRAASRYWHDEVSSPRGHRAVCFHCGSSKHAGWLRCSACETLPELSAEAGLSLLLSERACSGERLEELGRRIRLGEEPVAQDVSRLFATALYRSSAEHEEPVGRPVPGTVESFLSADRRAAVLLEVHASGDFVTDKPACAEFIREVGERLLEEREAALVDELVFKDGRSVHDVKADLVKRLGSKLHFERWQRLEVERGAVGTHVIGGAVSGARGSRPHRLRPCGNLAVAAVALSTPHLEEPQPAVYDLAAQLALQVTRLHTDTRGVEDIALPARTSSASLATERFAFDPSLSVAEAIAVLSAALGSEVKLEAVVCFSRSRFEDDDPSHFPGEAAMHG